MLNQSFSEENFKKILEIQNRKGIYLEGDFFPEIADISKKIKALNSQFKTLKGLGLKQQQLEEEKDKLNDQKEKLKLKREKLLTQKLTEISAKVTDNKFKVEIVLDKEVTSRPVYKIEYNLENILTLKQLQYNFRKLYKVKQANRYSIISQLKSLLDDGFPKIILKTDIKEFYENIVQDKLLKKLTDDNLLTHLSRKFIKQILLQYNNLTGLHKGVPRGIGISAYLVELYMRDFDRTIKTLPNVIYYSRYVDDIIIIFLPPINDIPTNYKSIIKNFIEKENLTMNEDIEKTKVIDISDIGIDCNYQFDYLGYSFSSGYHRRKHIPLKIGISRKKKKRYAKRLLKAFELYIDDSKRNEKKARKLFVKRIRFLMNNTRLVNNKKNILTGIYYSNNLINNLEDLRVLDRYFKYLLYKSNFPQQLINRISINNSFEAGFDASKLKKFTSTDLKSIINGWTR
jgi:Reverse transcriptase (RNA-dependent DNA polymerase)